MAEKSESTSSTTPPSERVGPVGDVVVNPDVAELARRIREREEPILQPDFSEAAIIERGLTGKSWKLPTPPKKSPNKAA